MCIPTDSDDKHSNIEIESERDRDEIRIRPARRLLKCALKKFARFSPDFSLDKRDGHEQAEKESL